MLPIMPPISLRLLQSNFPACSPFNRSPNASLPPFDKSLDWPLTEARIPPQAGCPRSPPCQAPPRQGPLVLPPPQGWRTQAQVRPWMHCRSRRPRSFPCCRQAGRGRHPRAYRPGSPQAPRTQGALQTRVAARQAPSGRSRELTLASPLPRQ